jgi:hypothetical protein
MRQKPFYPVEVRRVRIKPYKTNTRAAREHVSARLNRGALKAIGDDVNLFIVPEVQLIGMTAD